MCVWGRASWTALKQLAVTDEQRFTPAQQNKHFFLKTEPRPVQLCEITWEDRRSVSFSLEMDALIAFYVD